MGVQVYQMKNCIKVGH